MANRKLPYRWESVQPGDIISFKYKTQSTGKTRTHTLLVLNPALLRRGEKRTTTQLIGIKLEESNKIQLDITRKQIQIFELIGKFIPLDANSKDKNNLYRLEIDKNFIQNDVKGVKPRAYDLLSRGLGVAGQYRTFDYYRAKKSAVFLEPIRVLVDLKDEKIDNKPKQPEPPKEPELPKQPEPPKGDER